MSEIILKYQVYEMELTFSIRRGKGGTTYNFSVETLGEFYMLALHFHPNLQVLLNTFCSTRVKLEPSVHPASFVVHVNSYRWCMNKLLWLHLNETLLLDSEVGIQCYFPLSLNKYCIFPASQKCKNNQGEILVLQIIQKQSMNQNQLTTMYKE